MAEGQIETSITIAAEPARVWQILTDFGRMPSWNPFIPSISGVPENGQRLTVRIAPPGQRGMTFKPKVISAKPHHELRWLGSLIVPGLFDGEHYFELHPVGADSTRFVHGEKFSGLLVGLIMGQRMLDATRQGFEAMNQGLKRRVEQTAPFERSPSVRGA
jgi:hypothetical protein